MLKKSTIFIVYVLLCGSCKQSENNTDQTDLLVADLLKEQPEGITVSGSPKLVTSPYGAAVQFDGVDDALLLEEMPLKSYESFTIEMLFRPDVDGPFEQRIVHIGEVSDDRMLLEIRAVDGRWYFDGFVASGNNKKALIDDSLVHPLGQWYHVALVVTPDSLTTFVDGIQELQEPFTFEPINTGRSSIGVRLNEKSWYKGMIYRIRITPGELHPKDFISNF